VVTNSPQSPSFEHDFSANFSNKFSFSVMSHSNWSTRDMFHMWMFRVDDDTLVRLVLIGSCLWDKT
jgi:hypothetical protein